MKCNGSECDWIQWGRNIENYVCLHSDRSKIIKETSPERILLNLLLMALGISLLISGCGAIML